MDDGPAPSHASRRGRVLIVDPDRRVRRSLTDLLSVADDLELFVAVGDRDAALDAMATGSIDVVLIDPYVAGGASLTLIDDVRARWPEVPVLVMSCSDDVAGPAMDHGARAFLPKEGRPEALIQALRDAVRTLGPAA
jgi:DNA-binding NarL/FixJ family response regulator